MSEPILTSKYLDFFGGFSKSKVKYVLYGVCYNNSVLIFTPTLIIPLMALLTFSWWLLLFTLPLLVLGWGKIYLKLLWKYEWDIKPVPVYGYEFSGGSRFGISKIRIFIKRKIISYSLPWVKNDN